MRREACLSATVVLVGLLVVGACVPASEHPGSPMDRPLPEGACRTTDDCPGGEACGDGSGSSSCGDCFWPTRACESDAACADGWVCVEHWQRCSCDGPSSNCEPACASDTNCGAAERCDTASGHCTPWSCAEGYACGALETCAPATGGTGCVPLTCAHDSDCGTDGWCMQGACSSTPGTCEEDIPVP